MTLAEPSGDDEPVAKDDAYFSEVRMALGRGVLTVLLGTSSRALDRGVDRLRALVAAEQPEQDAQIKEEIDHLLQELQAGALEDEYAKDVLDDVQRLHTEVHSRRPSEQSIRLLLRRIIQTVSSSPALAATADQVKELITKLLHGRKSH
jgi:hypothetical protein